MTTLVSILSGRTILNKIYNWVKYKSLPPSVNFKNRLFIERENKHRRITINLGMAFRNSQWADYRRPNLSPSFVQNFKTFLYYTAAIIVFTLLLISANKYFLLSNELDRVASTVWSYVDTSIHTGAMTVTALVISIQQLLTAAYTRLLGKLAVESERLFKSTSFPSLALPKTVKRRAFYHWAVVNRASSKLLEDLYSKVEYTKYYPENEAYCRVLFKLSKSIGFDFSVLVKVRPNENGFIRRSNNKLGRRWDALLLNKPLEGSTSSPDFPYSTSRWALDTDTNWELGHVGACLPLVRRDGSRGPFTISSTNFNLLNSSSTGSRDLPFLNDEASEQAKAPKIARWVYKYNLLHRKFLLSSHNNTLTKRLLNSGFYDSSFFDKNANSQSLLNAHTNPSSFFKAGFLETYANFLVNPSQEGINTSGSSRWLQLDSAAQLSSYEESYQWAVKRFYFFNTLPSLGRASLPLMGLPAEATDSVSSNLNLSVAQSQLSQLSNLAQYSAVRAARRSNTSDLSLVELTASPTLRSSKLAMGSTDLWTKDSVILSSRLSSNDFISDSDVPMFLNSRRSYADSSSNK